ncbi:MAG: hypothetical protein KatS3mg004_1878 [Bryobacteraceae bacterium]|nr:MAG: hypothetical protein KatS3mg004_1878 [Bryobacteraceae bacterium]
MSDVDLCGHLSGSEPETCECCRLMKRALEYVPPSADHELAAARSIAAEPLARGHWCLIRDGGRGMRVMSHTRDEQHARKLFDRHCRRMRQGSLLLLRPDGALADYASEPMCRRRW